MRGRRKVGESYRSSTDAWDQIGHVGRVRERGTWISGGERIWRDRWAAAGALKLGGAAAALGCSCCCCFLFIQNRKTKEQMHRGIGEGCMRDIRISP